MHSGSLGHLPIYQTNSRKDSLKMDENRRLQRQEFSKEQGNKWSHKRFQYVWTSSVGSVSSGLDLSMFSMLCLCMLTCSLVAQTATRIIFMVYQDISSQGIESGRHYGANAIAGTVTGENRDESWRIARLLAARLLLAGNVCHWRCCKLLRCKAAPSLSKVQLKVIIVRLFNVMLAQGKRNEPSRPSPIKAHQFTHGITHVVRILRSSRLESRSSTVLAGAPAREPFRKNFAVKVPVRYTTATSSEDAWPATEPHGIQHIVSRVCVLGAGRALLEYA